MGESTRVLEEMPEIASASLPYWDAFQRLSGQRELGGMGAVGAIRLEAITHWLNEQGIVDSVERERYRYYLEQMDGEYLSLRLEQMEKQQAEIQRTTRVRSR